jgi:preprotein translocase subunit SecA
VGTGEGKSLIIAMLAAFHVLRGHSRVNVLVDNLSLLERDFATFEGLFTALGITSASAASQQQVDANVQVQQRLRRCSLHVHQIFSTSSLVVRYNRVFCRVKNL